MQFILLLNNHWMLVMLQQMLFGVFFLALGGFVSATSLYSSGSSVQFDGIPYFISPYSSGKLSLEGLDFSSCVSAGGLYPITLLGDVIARGDFASVVKSFTDEDDVFQTGFLQIIYAPDGSELGDDAMSAYGVNSMTTSGEAAGLAQGPYFLSASSGDIYMAYRLYSDFAGSFTEALLASPDGNFTTLSAAIQGTASLTIGVPSRLYYTPSAEQPLAGIRVGVKDIYDIAGIKTGNGNRAFYNLYPPASVNSVVVQKLVDAGAVIVGKQKTSQFANGETATADWVDYHSPFNPRADGYQDPSSSSAGAGSSIGSYPWLDIAVGSDTGGSIRGPSGVQGLYGNRPTHNAVDLTGVMPLSPALDTAGFLTRDPDIWAVAQDVLYGPLQTYKSYPNQVLTYNFPTNASASPANAVALDFLAKLQAFLSARMNSVNLSIEWELTRPEKTPANLTELLNLTYPVIITKQQTALVRDPFYVDYAAANDGRTPFINPAALARWTYGDTLPESALGEALQNKTLFMDWFNSKILIEDPVTCSNAFLLYLQSAGASNARNRYLNPPAIPFGFNSGRLSVYSECPDSVYPIGQVPFFSNITSHTEFLPVSISILAARGCDGVIANLARDLVAAGILNATLPGQTIFGGEILMKRGEDGEQ